MKVVFYNRGLRKGNFSFELLFKNIQDELRDVINIENYYNNENQFRFFSIIDARKHQGDVNHITGDVNYLSIGLSPVRTILTIHDLGYFENPIHSLPKRTIYKFFWLKVPISRSKIVTTVSEFTKQKILEYFNVSEDKIKVVPNPLFKIYKYKPKEFNKKPIILQIGTGKHKNLRGLIEAVKELDCKLWLIGFPSQDEIERMTLYKIDYEIFNNLTEVEMFQKYIDADMLYFASYYEGFGLPIIEANAVGRPVITSNCAAMPETAGDAAHIVDPTNIEQIRQGIITIFKNPDYRNKLIQSGLRNAQKYSLKEVSFKYFDLYKQVYSN